MEKIVVTGATGMIGSAVVRCALKDNMSVVCIVHKNSMRLNHIPQSKNVTLLYADLSDYKDIETSISDCDAFFHFAWEKTSATMRDSVESQAKNILYTLDAVQLAKRMGCKVFVGAGSQAEYGPVDFMLSADSPTNPKSGYGIAKLAAGKMSNLLCFQLGMRHNWVRILSVYGPYDGSNTLISYVMEQLRKNDTPELTKCEQIWDYLYCDDAAKAFLDIAKEGKDSKTYVLGSGKGNKLFWYVNTIRDIMNPKMNISYGVKDYYPYQPMHLVADITPLKQDVGWEPMTSFQQGISNILKLQNQKG